MKIFIFVVAFLLCLTPYGYCAPELESDSYIQRGNDVLMFFDANDPWETTNRRIYRFNIKSEKYVLKPVSEGYKYVMPDIAERGVHNVFTNIGQIPVFLNSALQLKGKKTLTTAGRFITNLTVGVLGLWDPATEWFDIPEYQEDFGQTLGHYKTPPGPYIMLPILGPSNCRDTVGYIVDSVTLSFLYPASTPFGVKAGVGTLKGTDTRVHSPFIYGGMDSLFEYEKVRSIYTKAREITVSDGHITNGMPRDPDEK